MFKGGGRRHTLRFSEIKSGDTICSPLKRDGENCNATYKTINVLLAEQLCFSLVSRFKRKIYISY